MIITPDQVRRAFRANAPALHLKNRRRILLPAPSVAIQGIVRSWKLIDAESGKVKRSCTTPYSNVIVDAGLDAIGNETFGMSDINDSGLYMAVGTNNTVPSQSDTALGNEVARTNTQFSQNSGSGTNFDYWWERETVEFSKSQANDTLAELGKLQGSSGGPMWMRQLFKDDQGNNTTITKTSSEILRIQYEVRVYPQKTVKQKTLDVDTRGTLVSTTVDYQPQLVNDSQAWGMSEGFAAFVSHALWGECRLKAWDNNALPGDFQSDGPASSTNQNSINDLGSDLSTSAGSYTAGSFQRDVTFDVVSSALNWPNGIGAMAFGPEVSREGWVSFFDPQIDKTDTDELSITVRFSWGRKTV